MSHQSRSVLFVLGQRLFLLLSYIQAEGKAIQYHSRMHLTDDNQLTLVSMGLREASILDIIIIVKMFRNFVQRLRESENRFLVGIFGAVTITGIAYLAYRSLTRKTHKSHIQVLSQHDIEEVSPNLQEPKLHPANEQLTKSLIRVVNNVKNAAKNSQDFAYEAVKAIYQGYHDLSFQEFKRLALQSRKLRRQSFDRLEIYRQILASYQKQIDEARTRSLKSILEFFKLQMRQWLVLAQKYSEECKQQWDQVMILTDVKQLNGLRNPDAASLNPQIMIQIFQYKDQVFDEVLHAAAQLFPERNSTELYNFVDRRLSDLVFLKFGTEDEDIFFSMIVISPSTKEKIEDFEQRINTRLQKFVSNALP